LGHKGFNATPDVLAMRAMAKKAREKTLLSSFSLTLFGKVLDKVVGSRVVDFYYKSPTGRAPPPMATLSPISGERDPQIVCRDGEIAFMIRRPYDAAEASMMGSTVTDRNKMADQFLRRRIPPQAQRADYFNGKRTTSCVPVMTTLAFFATPFTPEQDPRGLKGRAIIRDMIQPMGLVPDTQSTADRNNNFLLQCDGLKSVVNNGDDWIEIGDLVEAYVPLADELPSGEGGAPDARDGTRPILWFRAVRPERFYASSYYTYAAAHALFSRTWAEAARPGHLFNTDAEEAWWNIFRGEALRAHLAAGGTWDSAGILQALQTFFAGRVIPSDLFQEVPQCF
jgi:hypothetical protein